MNNRIEEKLIDNMARQEENFNDTLSMIAKFNNNLIKEAKKQARKETAREILQELSKMRTDGTRGDIFYKIDKLAEKFGVEVE